LEFLFKKLKSLGCDVEDEVAGEVEVGLVRLQAVNGHGDALGNNQSTL